MNIFNNMEIVLSEKELHDLIKEGIKTALQEKSVSKAQQRFFGMVDAYKKGELKNPSKSIKDAADNMTKKEIKKFASTKHKGLPNHVKSK